MNKSLKTILIIVGAVLIAVVIAGGSFYGGTAYQRSRASQIQEDFFASRGGQPPAGGFVMQSDGQAPSGTFMGRGLTGEIQTLNDDTLLVTTNDGVITVKLSDSTRIQKSVDISTNELTAGTSVSIMGQQKEDGTIAAEQIQIIDPSMPQQFSPQATGTAP